MQANLTLRISTMSSRANLLEKRVTGTSHSEANECNAIVMLISTRQIFYSKRSDRAMGRQTQRIHLYPDQSTRAYTCVYCASLKITHNTHISIPSSHLQISYYSVLKRRCTLTRSPVFKFFKFVQRMSMYLQQRDCNKKVEQQHLFHVMSCVHIYCCEV